MAIDIAAIPALGVEPIAPDSPAGENLQDDFKFDQLQADVQALINQLGTTAEMDAVGDREPPKWENVALQAFDMLKTRSKDIRIASFLTIATAHVQGYSGLAACIEMVSGLLTNFWDTMYPPLKLLRGRVNTLGFIATHVAGESDEPGGLITLRVAQLREELDEAKSPSASLDAQRLAVEKMTAELEALKACQEQIGKLRDLIYEKFPQDKLPAVTSLTDAVKAALPELEQLVAQNKPREPAAPSAPAAGGEPRPAAAASRPAPSAAAISAESPEEAFKAMGRLAPMIRQADATHPAAYRLSRWAAWSALTMLPPTTDGVKTRVPEPPKQEIDQCNALLASANWMALLNQSEERMQTTPLWLDRQFHVYSALGGLGGAYKAAQEAVRGEVANLLRRLPGL
ncbi:MAG TPA: TssA family type VI secretion system protein, partial [Candidatus Sumerlaeota bacterium]|nr:TssA family type VI secretion system protein [Candidatus Sumerlaeota bacterium]